MADFFVPANIFQGRGSGESPGTGLALGDQPLTNFLGFIGVDYMPNSSEAAFGPVGGINHKSIGVLATDATGDSDKEQPAAFLEAFERMGANAAQFRITVPGASEIVIDQCAFAGPMASGSYYIAPSDVGNGPGQIPGGAGGSVNWTSPILRPHVSVFVRDASHIRGVVSQINGADVVGQTNQNPSAVQVFAVDTVPRFSNWTLVVDGHAMSVIFLHVDGNGVAIDVRRPRDIYEQIVVPELTRRIAQAEPMPLWKDAGAGNVVSRGFISRLNYVSYARFGFFDTTTIVRPIENPA